jgi:UDP-3-O-[3-hydroxymyristoyl] glucosamine N-acyltransferase
MAKTVIRITEWGEPHSIPGLHVFDQAQVLDAGQVFGRVFDKALVQDRASVLDQATVSGMATLSDDSTVKCQAQVSGSVRMFDLSVVLDQAQVSGNVNLLGSTVVRDQAQVSGLVNLNSALVTDSARIDGLPRTPEHVDFMRINGSKVMDRAQVTGRVIICDGAHLSDDAKVQDFAILIGLVQVRDQARVSGHARVSDCILQGTVHVTGSAQIYGGTWTEGIVSTGSWDAPGVPHTPKESFGPLVKTP